MNKDSTTLERNWLVPLLVVILGPVLTGGLFAAQLAIAGFMKTADAFRFTLPLWLPWVLFAPLTASLAFRFPIERLRMRTSIIVHLMACALIIAGNQVVTRRFMSDHGFDRPPTWMLRERERNGFGPVNSSTDENPKGIKDLGGPAVARIAMDILVYGILLSACQTVLSSRRARDRERRALTAESHLAQARLSALRMQLNPHFLFNSLNGISTLVHTDPRAADDMIGNLSEFLRLSLDSTGEEEVPLLRELNFLQSYLNIEQARFGNRLQVVRDIAQDTLIACVPTLILQPIIENAIRHGFENITTSGIITIIARRDEDQLHVEIRDNGAGLRSSFKEGIGLGNTRARLQVLYGKDQLFTLSQSDSGGCVAEIRLPFHNDPISSKTFPSS